MDQAVEASGTEAPPEELSPELASEVDGKPAASAPDGNAEPHVPETHFAFDRNFRICGDGQPLAAVVRGDHVLRPDIRLCPLEDASQGHDPTLQERIAKWLAARIEVNLPQLVACRDDGRYSRPLLPITRRLAERLGIVPRHEVAREVAALSADDRQALGRLGVRLGVHALYLPDLLRPIPLRLRAGLWMVHHQRDALPNLPPDGRTSMELPSGADRQFYADMGFLPLGRLVIRVDAVEKLSALARQEARQARADATQGPRDAGDASSPPVQPGDKLPPGWFAATAAMRSLIGCSEEELAAVLGDLGYRVRAPSASHRGYAFSALGAGRGRSNEPGRSRGGLVDERRYFADMLKPAAGATLRGAPDGGREAARSNDRPLRSRRP
ncbi:MAG: hypothetical protein U1E23_10620 [Reyranellaceae bacterium]